MNNKEQFIIFLRSQEVSDTTSKIYVDKLSNRINEICAKQRRASSFDIFSIGSLSEAQKIVEELQSDPIYISSNEKDHRIGSSAISWFLKFWRCKDLFKETTHITSENKNFTSDAPLQQITYGAPGTGKSHQINEAVNTYGENSCIRTTFHPDSDYASFVGSYKPTTKGGALTYSFSPQAFTQAYIRAWSNLQKPFFLVIEEINRGNCAQIFGDLFQLLDRNPTTGFSNYSIIPDADLGEFISSAMNSLDIPAIDGLPIDDIKSGRVLTLPCNLHIWATMNTSDQSLFPIDSAFKRRWKWKYIPIKNQGLGWKININGLKFDWWEFISTINNIIGEQTQSEDKKLGYFFVNCGMGKEISTDEFVSKVIFYLWYDVFRDLDFEGPIFRKNNTEQMQFSDFYNGNGNINTLSALQVMENIGVMAEDATEPDGE